MHVNGAVRAASARVLGVDYSLCRFAFNPLLSTGDFTEILEKRSWKKGVCHKDMAAVSARRWNLS